MQTTRKTLIGTLLTGAVAAGLACGATLANAADALPYGLKPGKPYAGTKLTYLAPVAGQYEGHEARLKEFTDLTGIEVEFEFIPFRNLLEKILSIKVAGDADPDLINYKDDWGPGLKDLFVPIDKMMSEDKVTLDRYYPAHQLGVTYDGKIYGLPLRGHAQLMFYRKDLLEKHGLSVPKTWDELARVAKVIKDKEGIGIGMYYSPKAAQNVAVWMNILWSNGGELFKGGKVTFNSPEAVEALKYYVALENDMKVNSEGAKSFEQYDGSLSMGAGQSAFFMGWWWHYGSRILGKNTKLKPEQVGFAPLPAFKGDKSTTFAMSMPTAINANSRKQAAAWEFLKWVSNPDLEKRNVIEKEKRNVIVALHKKNLMDKDVNAANQGLQMAAAGSLESSRIFLQLAVWPEVMQVLANAISDAVSNGADPKKALDAAAKKAQKLVDRG